MPPDEVDGASICRHRRAFSFTQQTVIRRHQEACTDMNASVLLCQPAALAALNGF
jgi:hypothetical protein